MAALRIVDPKCKSDSRSNCCCQVSHLFVVSTGSVACCHPLTFILRSWGVVTLHRQDAVRCQLCSRLPVEVTMGWKCSSVGKQEILSVAGPRNWTFRCTDYQFCFPLGRSRVRFLLPETSCPQVLWLYLVPLNKVWDIILKWNTTASVLFLPNP